MSVLGRLQAGLGIAVLVVVLGLGAPADADGGLQRCIDQAVNHDGDPPVCTKVNGSWVASWPDDPSGGGGDAGTVVLLLLLGVLVAAALIGWKVSTARRLARESGMDAGLATQMTLLTDDGLDATYLAASLRTPAPAPAATPAAAPPPAVAERLATLTGLLDAGLVTQQEYDERRRAIIDSV